MCARQDELWLQHEYRSWWGCLFLFWVSSHCQTELKNAWWNNQFFSSTRSNCFWWHVPDGIWSLYAIQLNDIQRGLPEDSVCWKLGMCSAINWHRDDHSQWKGLEWPWYHHQLRAVEILVFIPAYHSDLLNPFGSSFVQEWCCPVTTQNPSSIHNKKSPLRTKESA